MADPAQQQQEVSLSRLVEELARSRALDLRGYKPSSLGRRVRRRMAQLNVHSYAEYLNYIYSEPAEANTLLNTILINVTEFFRDPQAWEVVRQEVLPRLLRRLQPGDTFRAWSAGCASGEEPYSLAILVSDFLGERLPEFDIKIYATDIDEDALDFARRGEYEEEKLRRVRPQWKQRYFTGRTRLRINREQRRLVIFGRSNLMTDAPISHCQLVICRNVLIYFDSPSQRQILARIHYALEPGGVLFLGKAESKLSESHLFRPVDLRWRLFERLDGAGAVRSTSAQEQHRSMRNAEKPQQELNRMELYQRALLNALHSGLMLLDANDVLLTHNEAVLGIWGLPKAPLSGKRLQDTEISARCPELVQRVEESRAHPQPVTFQYNVRFDGETKVIQVDIQPVVSPQGERTGTIVHCDDITAESTLQSTVEQLEATGEELQSANEELETTNEELQSTNEELETTNEELQSTNEELETTNEELQSLNEELENMNDELESRTRELNDLTSRYAETLQRMPWPVMLVDRSEKVQLWNAAAQRLLGVGAASVAGAEISRLPIDKALTDVLVRRCRAALAGKKESVVKGQKFRLGSTSEAFDIHFTHIMSEPGSEGVLVMFAASGVHGGTSDKATPGKGGKVKAQAKQGVSRKKGSGDPRSRKRG